MAETTKKKVKFSIRWKVLIAALLPLMLTALVITTYSMSRLRSEVQDEALRGLKDLCYSLEATYESFVEGDYSLEGDHMKKGDFDITAHEEILDSFIKDSEADITLFYDDTRRATSLKDKKTGERIIGTKASDQVIQTTLKGGEVFTTTDIVINEENYYAVYVPLKAHNGSIVGMAFAGQPSKEIDSMISSSIRACVMLAVIIFLIVAVIVFLFVNKITSLLSKVSNHLVTLSEGDLTLQIDKKMISRGDELGVMANSLNLQVTKLKSVMTEILQSSEVLSGSSIDLKDFASSTNNATDEISRAVEDMSQGSVSQADDVESATVQVGEMGSAIQLMVDEIEALYSNSEKMERSKSEAEEIVGELSSSSDHTMEAVQRIGKQVKLTDDSVTQIQQAVALITSIAEETNLLSLNASIEAARAGEAGKGFAVVASQIQKLAEESNSSAASIADVIQHLSAESKNTVDAMESMHAIILDQQQKLKDTETKFNEVSAGIQSSLEQINEIRSGSETCDAARAKVTDIIQSLSAVSEENAAATQETTASMQELNSTMTILTEKSNELGDLAAKMNEDMSFFKMS